MTDKAELDIDSSKATRGVLDLDSAFRKLHEAIDSLARTAEPRLRELEKAYQKTSKEGVEGVKTHREVLEANYAQMNVDRVNNNRHTLSLVKQLQADINQRYVEGFLDRARVNKKYTIEELIMRRREGATLLADDKDRLRLHAEAQRLARAKQKAENATEAAALQSHLRAMDRRSLESALKAAEYTNRSMEQGKLLLRDQTQAGKARVAASEVAAKQLEAIERALIQNHLEGLDKKSVRSATKDAEYANRSLEQGKLLLRDQTQAGKARVAASAVAAKQLEAVERALIQNHLEGMDKKSMKSAAKDAEYTNRSLEQGKLLLRDQTQAGKARVAASEVAAKQLEAIERALIQSHLEGMDKKSMKSAAKDAEYTNRSMEQGRLLLSNQKRLAKESNDVAVASEADRLKRIKMQVSAATNASDLPYQRYSPTRGIAGAVRNVTQATEPGASPLLGTASYFGGALHGMPMDTSAVDRLNKAMGETNKHSALYSWLLKKNTADMGDAHSMARGLASGFNLLWLTWGSMVPLMTGAAISMGMRSIIQSGAEVHDTLTQIKTLAGGTSAEIAVLNRQLLDMSANSIYGPKEIADSMKTLALAGLSASQVFSAMPELKNFSVAGSTTMKQAAEVLTSIGTAFNISAAGYGYISDVVSKAAAESKSSVESMSEAFKTASVIHQQYGVSLKDTAIGLSLMANAGIQGSAAGTALRNMYADLAGRTPKVTKTLRELGVATIEAGGKMRSQGAIFADFMKGLDTKDVTSRLATINAVFSERGGKEAVAIMNSMDAVINKHKEATGVVLTYAQAYNKLGEAIENSQGFAIIAAVEQSLTPLNQMKQVVSTFQTALYSAFNGVQPMIMETSRNLQEVFKGEKFKNGVADIATAVATLVSGFVAMSNVIVPVTAAVLAVTSAVSLASVGVATYAAGATAAAAGTSTFAAALTVLGANPLMLVVKGVLMVTAAIIAYKTAMGDSSKTTAQFTTVSLKDMADGLEKEHQRLNKINEAREKGIDLYDLEAKAALNSASVQTDAALIPLQAELVKAQLRAMDAAPGTPWRTQMEEDVKATTAAIANAKLRVKEEQRIVTLKMEAIKYDRQVANRSQNLGGVSPDSPVPQAPAVEKATKASKAYDKALEYRNGLLLELEGHNAKYRDQLDMINLVYAREQKLNPSKALSDRNLAITRLTEKQPAIKELYKTMEDAVTKAEQEADAAEKATLKHQDLTSALYAEQVARLEVMQSVQAMKLATTDYAKESDRLLDYDKLTAIEAELKAKRRTLKATADDEENKARAAAKKEWDKTYETIAENMFKAFTDKDGLANLAKSLEDWAIGLVLKPMIKPMAEKATDILTGKSAITGSTPLEKLSSVYDTLTAGFVSTASSIGTSIASAIPTINTLFGNGAAVTTGQFAGGLMSTGSQAGMSAAWQSGGASAAGMVAGRAIGGLSGYYGSKALSGGYSIDGLNVNAIAGIASAVMPAFAPVIALIGAGVNRAFGHGATELTASGTRGTFSGNGFSGNSYASYKQAGGWFTQDKNWTVNSALSAENVSAWSYAFATMKQSIAGMAEVMNLSTATVAGYTRYVDIAAGTSEADITALFTTMADELTLKLAPAIMGYAHASETASAVLSRLKNSLSAANTALTMTRNRLFEVSLAGADYASTLVDAFGSLENLTSKTKSYYESFFSESEQMILTQQNLGKAFALLNMAVPESETAFRDLVSSLDVTTVAGAQTYAVLMEIAPEFKTIGNTVTQLAKDTSENLLKTFTANGQLLPTLGQVNLSLANLNTATGNYTNSVTYVNAVMGDATSAIIALNHTVATSGDNSAVAKTALDLMNSQIDTLSARTGTVTYDLAGLTNSLANFNTETFMQVIMGVFTTLASNFKDLFKSVVSERIAVREAVKTIVGPQAYSYGELQAKVSGAAVAFPSGTALANAATALYAATLSAEVATSDRVSWQTAEAAQAAYSATKVAAAQQSVADAASEVARLSATVTTNNPTYEQTAIGSTGGSRFGWVNHYTTTVVGSLEQIAAATQVYNNALFSLDNTVALATTAQSSYAAAVAQAITTESLAIGLRQSAEANSALVTLQNTQALQDYSVKAEKSVKALGNLREETVKYYEEQKRLADLMAVSAAGIRKTIADYRFSQLSEAAQLVSLQGEFASTYTLAMGASGELLAGYGDKLSTQFTTLAERLDAAGKGNLIEGYLAQLNTVATKLEESAPKNYQAESLGLLASIDSLLASLEQGTFTASQVLEKAINATTDMTATGLRAVVKQLGGTPGFYTGGSHRGGARWVGEDGPELEVTGPSHIYNMSQLSRMGGSSNTDTSRLEMLVERQAQQLEAMSYELKAIASSNARMVKLADRADQEGLPVRTLEGSPIQVETVV